MEKGPSTTLCFITDCFLDPEILTTKLTTVHIRSSKPLQNTVIDGVSSEGTLIFLKSLSSKISNWHRETYQDLSNVMNNGLKRAKGQYILFLNTGDAFDKWN